MKNVIHKWFYIEDDRVVDLVMAGYVANRFNADPVWIIFIAPPSNTKTELLRSFDKHKDAVFISNLTPSTLVSGIKPKKDNPDPSLLPLLNDKMVILKDFTSVLSMRSENQQEILAQLREAYDGQYSKMFGNGKKVEWSGRFGLMAACTPVYDSHYGVIGSMGERFLLYRTESMNGERMGMQAQKIVGQEDVMRAEIRQTVHTFINQFEALKSNDFKKDDDVNGQIIDLACFCAYGRCPVERDYRNQAVKYQPIPEGTPRLVKQFMQIGMGLALVNGKTTIDREIYQIIKKIGRDLLPTQRLRVIQYLWDQKAVSTFAHWLDTTEVAEGVNLPGMTAKLLLEDLMVVGALNRNKGEAQGGRPPWMWQISQKMGEFIGGASVFDE